MYPPPYHQESHLEKLLAVIQQHPLATLISADGNGSIVVTHVPVVYKPAESGNGKLIGHIDADNPHCAILDEKPVLMIFNGPDAYISPTVYTTPQFPTWNYIRVHIEGTCRLISDPMAIAHILIDLTNQFEHPGSYFTLQPDHPRMMQLVPYIRGFEITIERWEGKFKLGQDKIEADRIAAKAQILHNTPVPSKSFIDGLF